MARFQRLLSALIHPNVAYLLLCSASSASTSSSPIPARSFPAWSAASRCCSALYALSVLPVRFAGVALILLGLALFVAEVKVTSYGLLAVGGLIALVLGSLMLFGPPSRRCGSASS